MGLREYHRKRDFKVTPEPKGEEKKTPGRSFVIQKHAASRLHYDFRLEMEGVLKSWAVPKGPCLDPAQKRLAMMTEDHPVDYGDFEGIIPEGEYGGGTVLLWDNGTWEPLGDPHKDLRAGRLKFRLHGQKLRGGWMLVRTKGRDSRDRERSWLLFKERDEEARPLSEYDITADRPESVTTGRDLETIAGDQDRVWRSNRAVSVPRKRARAVPPPKPALPFSPESIPGARRATFPRAPKVQLATLVDAPPEGDEWLHEMKFDGYRILALLRGGKATLMTRNDNDWTTAFADVAQDLARLPVKEAVIDGEAAIVLPDGTTSFQALQNWMTGSGGHPLVFFAFDLLYIDGYDLTASPLEERKAALEKLLAAAPGGIVRYSQHVVGNGQAFFDAACRRKVEGILCKQRRAPYAGTRTRSWVKVKCLQEQEFVIGGFTDPEGTRESLGALLLGVHDEKGRLKYVGRVGTGFTDKILRDLYKRLKALEQKTSPFANKVTGRAVGRAHWVKPELVAEVAFGEWTGDGKLRHPSFKGLRQDKPSTEIVKEEPVPVQSAAAARAGAAARSGAEELPHSAAVVAPQAPRSGVARRRDTPDRKKDPSIDVSGVRLTNPDRVLYPDQGVTKLDLARYYEAIADWILPHLKGRPTTLVRCPEGLASTKPCFYQKHTGWWAPESLRRIKIREKTKLGEYLVADDLAGLIGFVQIGILEIHTWNSTAEALETPDRLVFDLDPGPDVEWKRVIEGARLVRDVLAERGLVSFVKTTGGKGLHIVAPIQPEHDWDTCEAFSKALAGEIVRRYPREYVDIMTKSRRQGKIYIDFLRNARGSTSIAAYSTRAKPNAPISTPLRWEELEPRIKSDQFTVKTLPRRLARLRQDPWKEYWTLRQRMPESWA